MRQSRFDYRHIHESQGRIIGTRKTVHAGLSALIRQSSQGRIIGMYKTVKAAFSWHLAEVVSEEIAARLERQLQKLHRHLVFRVKGFRFGVKFLV